jgi:glycosyltransferase involved in cell wall biosynthesis
LRILIVTNHFWPEEFRVNEIATGLRDKGHDITVITGIPNYPAGKFFPGYGILRKRVEKHDGMVIRRVPLIPRGKGGKLNLLLNYASATICSCLLAPWYGRGDHDLIFVFHTSPIMVALPAIIIRKLKSVPIIFWALDLWPESISATGAITSGVLLRQVESLVRFIYKRCDRILVSSPAYIPSVTSLGGNPKTLDYFPNWVESVYSDVPDGSDTAGLPVLPPGFRIMFAGNIGAAQSFETILSAAEILRPQADIQWIILGDGRMSAWVKEQVTSRKLSDTVRLFGRFPSETMPALFAQADAMLVTLRRDPIFSLTIPGKIQSYMASGRPIIAALDGEGASLVEQSGCGMSCPAEDAGALAETVLRLYNMSPTERSALGDQGRAYCLANFDRGTLLDRLEQWMKETISGNRTRQI